MHDGLKNVLVASVITSSTPRSLVRVCYSSGVVVAPCIQGRHFFFRKHKKGTKKLEHTTTDTTDE